MDVEVFGGGGALWRCSVVEVDALWTRCSVEMLGGSM